MLPIYSKKRTVEREHLSVAAYVIACARYGRDEEHGTQKGQHDHGNSYMAAVPADASLQAIEDDSQQGTHDDHGMEADQTALEEVAQAHCLSQTVVIGIADDKTGEDEEEIHGKVTVVDGGDDRASGGERQSFKDVVEYHQQGGHSSQSVEEFIMGFGVRKCG